MFKAEKCTEANFKVFCSAPGPHGNSTGNTTGWETVAHTDCFDGQDTMGTCTSSDVPSCKAQCVAMGNCGGINWPHKHFKPTGCGLAANQQSDEKLTLYALKPSNRSRSDSSVGSVYVQGRNARALLADAGWALAESPAGADLIWLINRCYLGIFVPSPSQEPRLLHTCPFASFKQASQLLPYLYIKCKGNTKEKKKQIGWEI